MDKITIETNNGNAIELSFTAGGNFLIAHKDENGATSKKYLIPDGEVVSLLNWYNYQKENGNKDLMF